MGSCGSPEYHHFNPGCSGGDPLVFEGLVAADIFWDLLGRCKMLASEVCRVRTSGGSLSWCSRVDTAVKRPRVALAKRRWSHSKAAMVDGSGRSTVSGHAPVQSRVATAAGGSHGSLRAWCLAWHQGPRYLEGIVSRRLYGTLVDRLFNVSKPRRTGLSLA